MLKRCFTFSVKSLFYSDYFMSVLSFAHVFVQTFEATESANVICKMNEIHLHY